MNRLPASSNENQRLPLSTSGLEETLFPPKFFISLFKLFDPLKTPPREIQVKLVAKIICRGACHPAASLLLRIRFTLFHCVRKLQRRSKQSFNTPRNSQTRYHQLRAATGMQPKASKAVPVVAEHKLFVTWSGPEHV